MRSFLANQDRQGAQTVLLAWLLCGLAAAQEPAVPAEKLAPTAEPVAAAAAAAAAVPAEKVAPAAKPAPQVGEVTANLLVVRARPASHYERIGQFGRGEKLTIVGGTADWFEVNIPADTRAWIAAQYISAEGVVTGDQVRLHCGPGLVFTTFATVKTGIRLDVVGPPVDGWQQVRAPADATAWVSRAYVRVLEPEPPKAPDVATATPPEAPAAAAPTAPAPATPAAAPTVGAEATPAAPEPAAGGEKPAVTEGPVATAPATAEPTPETAAAPVAPVAEPAVPVTTEPTPETAAPAPATPEATPATVIPVITPEPPPAPAAVETPAAPVLLAPPANAPVVMKEGILLSLKSQASEQASHVLCMRVGATAYPVCYLKSSRLDLTEWENRSVRVYGPELRIPGWNLAVLHVHSVQVNLK